MRYTYIIPIFFLLTVSLRAQTYTSDFLSGPDAWTADWADYPVGEDTFYELASAHTTLPAPLNQSKYSLMISGNNHSDDLFMFIKKQIVGLLPNTEYKVKFVVEFASNAPTNAFGVGGPPGEGVTMKAGATTNEPGVFKDSQDYYRMNIDKSNQSQGGADMDVIGHVGVEDTTTVYALITRDNIGDVFTVTTDASGKVWVIIGTDSGFEATTTLYYNTIEITFSDPVPVELASFSAVQETGGIALRWVTENETNNFGFDIERRTTVTWERIGFVPGHGTSSLRNEYRYTDPEYPADSPATGTVQYRLKQTDFDGTYEYSPIVEVEPGASPAAPGISGPWPNPTVGTLNATLLLPDAATTTVTLHSTAGQQVLTVVESRAFPAGAYNLTANTTALPSGTYLLRMIANGAVSARTVAIRR